MNASSRPPWAVADAYLFDIDGTLLNARDAVHYHAFRHAVQKVFGLDSNIDGVPVHGNTDIGILRAVLRREGVADAEIEARLPETTTLMCAEVRTHSSHIRAEICPSVAELLQRLHLAGRLLGVVSGNLESIGWNKLEVAGLRSVFEFGCFSDTTEYRQDIFRRGIEEVRKRLGRAATSCVLGDTPSDIRAAQAVGIPIIAVATGIFSRDELSELNPDACFSSCTELLPFIESSKKSQVCS